jgi:AcrR family transcriptional regulator
MPRAGLDRDAVIDAASRLADTEGLEAVTLTRLAESLGVKPPSLYKHVEGLDDIRRGLAVKGLREANRRLQQATVGKARDEALFALARAYWKFARDHPGLYAASQRAPLPSERDIVAAGEAMIGTVLAVLAGYGVKGDDALHATRGFRAIIHGFVSLDAAGGFKLALDLDESFGRLLGAFARDLAERGTPP